MFNPAKGIKFDSPCDFFNGVVLQKGSESIFARYHKEVFKNTPETNRFRGCNTLLFLRKLHGRRRVHSSRHLMQRILTRCGGYFQRKTYHLMYRLRIISIEVNRFIRIYWNHNIKIIEIKNCVLV